MAWKKTPADRKRDALVYGAAWRKLRAQVLDRDRRRCVLDGSTRQLTVDHITPVSRGGTNDLANLRTLCAACHRKKTSLEGGRNRSTTPPSDPRAKPSTAW